MNLSPVFWKGSKILNQGNPINVIIHIDFFKARDKKMRTRLDFEKVDG